MAEGFGTYHCSQTNFFVCSLFLNQKNTEVGEEPHLRQGLFPEEVIRSQDPEAKKLAEDSSGEHDILGT